MNEEYGIVLTCGTKAVPPGDHKVVDVTPDETSKEAVLAKLAGCGLTPADLRTQILLVLGTDCEDAVQRTLLVYAALIGFAGRRLSVAVDGHVINTAEFDVAVRQLPDAGKPPVVMLAVQVGPEMRQDLPVVPFTHLPTPKGVSMVRYARRVRIVAPTEPLEAVRQLVAVAAIRARGDQDRLPMVVVGDEPAPTEETYATPVGVDLELLRRAGSDLRRKVRVEDRGAVVDRAALTKRQTRLMEAAALPIEETMVRLGGRFNETVDAWHCPRPARHNNGDQNPSMRVANGKIRCGRCDAERVDSLRLTMDVTGFTPDEAADWLLGVAPRVSLI